VATTAYRLALQSDEVKESNVDYPLCFEFFFFTKKKKKKKKKKKNKKKKKKKIK
jgi:hypothetical protein